MKLKWILLLLLLSINLAPAAILSGTIKDNKTKKALAFANIAVYKEDNDSLKTGTMSGVDGCFRIFNVPEGKYYLVITYMGYEKKQVDDLIVNSKKVKLGTLYLDPTMLEMDNIVVEADKAAISYQIDKQIVDAKQFDVGAGATAVEILENVPSVQVDIEGNVSIQGERDFTVMIDGRPSILGPQNTLKTTLAETIDNIEIMTTASAKYSAEGGAGVINIVTKKNKIIGLSGLTTFRIGTTTINGSALISYRNKKIATYASFDSNLGKYKTGSYVDRYFYSLDSTANYLFYGDRINNSKRAGIRGGLDWYISKNDIVGFSAKYSPSISKINYNKDYTISYIDPITENMLSSNNYVSYDNSNSSRYRFNIVADYTHTFPEKKEDSPDSSASSKNVRPRSLCKHKMKFAASYSSLVNERESHIFLVDNISDTTEGQWMTKSNPSKSIQGKFEYKRPINKHSYFETGVDAAFNWKSDGHNVHEFNPLNGEFVIQDQFSNYTEYIQNTISAFAIYKAEFGKFGFQPGVRTEYTYRVINSEAMDSLYVIDSLHLFPTIHVSYELPFNIQCMASYSRRIARPSGFHLEPFYTWQDAYNISIGNPTLKPVVSDIFSLSLQKNFGKHFFTLNSSYRNSKDRYERVRTVYEEAEDVMLSTFENVGNSQSLNLGLSANLCLFKWWRMNISGNFYKSKITGKLFDEDYTNDNFGYFASFSTSFTLPTKTRVSVSGHYMSKSTGIQGSSQGMLMSSAGIRHSFFNKKLDIALYLSDIFGNSTHIAEIYTPTTYSYIESYHQAPTFSLSFSLKINDYKRYRNNDNFGINSFNAEGDG